MILDLEKIVLENLSAIAYTWLFSTVRIDVGITGIGEMMSPFVIDGPLFGDLAGDTGSPGSRYPIKDPNSFVIASMPGGGVFRRSATNWLINTHYPDSSPVPYFKWIPITPPLLSSTTNDPCADVVSYGRSL
jgi:hypothetical protein